MAEVGPGLAPEWMKPSAASGTKWLTPTNRITAMQTSSDPILKRFRAALDEMYGDRLERVVLFGSGARGDTGEGSDYDVAVFLNDLKEGDLVNRWRELDRLAGLRSVILSDSEAFIDAKPYPAGAYRHPTALMGEIRREGVDL